MNLRNHILPAAVVVASVLFVEAANAQHEHSDIEIGVDGTKIITEHRIAEAEFGEGLKPPNVADDPGFSAPDGTFAADSVVGFNSVVFDLASGGSERNLWYWDGVGAPSFGASTATLTIEKEFLGSLKISSADSVTATGFDFAQADAEGGVHTHMGFALSENPPFAGVYVLGLELTSPSYETSDSVYLVMAAGVTEDIHEAGVDFVHSVLIPEPSSFVLLALAVFGGFGWRLKST
jgi:hypothetical protein